jgi:hypothetical protein
MSLIDCRILPRAFSIALLSDDADITARRRADEASREFVRRHDAAGFDAARRRSRTPGASRSTKSAMPDMLLTLITPPRSMMPTPAIDA